MPSLDLLQKHLAFAAIAPTTLRGMLPIGARRSVCETLASLPLATLAQAEFPTTLDDWTDRLRSHSGASWGPRRKALNLYLRDASYNVWAREAFALDKLEPVLEIPLDGIVMRRLRKLAGRPMPTVAVIHLTKAISDDYQDVAAAVAKEEGEHRVHLDLEFWGGGVLT